MNKWSRFILVAAGISGMLTVVLGAFAAHGLKPILSGYLLDIYDTGIQYQAWHTFALIACGALLRLNIQEKTQKGLCRASICFMIGILCFSGSLYGLALTGAKWFGPITPFGGLMFIIGWGFFAYSALKMNEVTQ